MNTRNRRFGVLAACALLGALPAQVAAAKGHPAARHSEYVEARMVHDTAYPDIVYDAAHELLVWFRGP